MSIFDTIKKYLAAATQAVHEVQQVAVPGATKKQLAVGVVLAAAHAGETVDNATVQKVSAIVEFALSIAKSLGTIPSAAAQPPVVVPTADVVGTPDA